MKQLTVACLLWVGPDTRYTQAWVYRLREQVWAHLPVAFRFVCLSNVDVPGVEVIPLRTDWETWWAKCEIFDPTRNLGERVLYLDLDVFVTGDLTPIAFFDAPMAMMPPSYMFADQPARELPGVVRRYQASCISFEPPAGREIYELLTPEIMREFRSDQDWIGHIKPDCAVMPVEWFQKAAQCKNGLRDGVKLVLAQRVDLLGKTLAEVAR